MTVSAASYAPTMAEADLAQRTYSKVNWRILPFLFFCYVLAFVDRVNISFAHLEFNHDIGLSEGAYGFGVGLFFVGYIIFEVPSNLLLHRVGARRTIARIMVLWGIISTSMMFVTTPMQFYVARVALGVAEAGFFPGVILYLTYWYPAARRARVTSRFVLGIAFSGIVSGIVSGWIMQNMGDVAGLRSWQWLFLLEGAPSIITGIVAFFYIVDKPEQASWLAPEEKALIQRNLAIDDQAKIQKDSRTKFREAIKNPRVYICAGAYFVIPWAGSVLNFYSPAIIKQSGVTNFWHIGLLSAVPYVIGSVGMLLMCWHSDTRLERRWHFATAAFITAVGVIGVALTNSEWSLAIICLSIMAIGYLSVTSLFWPIPTAYLSGTAAAGGIALISSLAQFGGLLAPMVIGWLKGATNSIAPGLILVGVAMVAGGLIILIGVPKQALNERRTL